MSFYKSKFFCFFYLLLASLSLLPFLIGNEEDVHREKKVNELYDSNLSAINSIDKAIEYIESLEGATDKEHLDTFSFVSNASKFTKNRFYHGLSRYYISENWIASLSGVIFWDHFSAIVNPDDILKHSAGLCSQQTIVFMEILKKRGIQTRSIGLGYKEGPGHFLSEVYYNGNWHLYDVNMEPDWTRIKNHHLSMDYYMANKDTLFKAYQGQIEKQKFYKIMEKVEYGSPNKFPAKNMFVFHWVTKIVILCLPFFFFVMAMKTYYKRSDKVKVFEAEKGTISSSKSKKIISN